MNTSRKATERNHTRSEHFMVRSTRRLDHRPGRQPGVTVATLFPAHWWASHSADFLF